MTRGRLFQLASFLGAVGLFVWLLGRIGWSNIGRTLAHVGWRGAIVVGALGAAESICDGVALAVALGNRTRAVGVIAFNSIGGALNQLLPFDLGEVAKIGLMHRAYPQNNTISGTVVWNYVFKISRPLVTLIAAVIGYVAYGQAPASFRRVVVLAAVLGFIPYLVFRLVLRRGGATFLVRIINWARQAPLLRRLPIPPSERLLNAAANIDEAALGFWDRRRAAFMVILLLQLVARTSSWISLAAALTFVVGHAPGFAQTALLYAAINSAEFVITVLPSRLGIAEFAAFGVFKVCGLDPAIGVVTYLVLRIKSLATNGALSPLALVAFATRPAPAAPVAEGQSP